MAEGHIIEQPERRRESALALLNPQSLISQAIEKGADINVLERLVSLAETVRAMQAKEAWYSAMADFQAKCPPIFKTKRGTTKSYSFTYAPIDEVLGTIQPVMGPLGLSVSWCQRFEAAAAVANCRISHALGHFEESGEVIIPIERSEDGRGATPAQRVGIAMTYAKRYALLSIAGIAPEDEEDSDDGSRQEPAREQDAGPDTSAAITISEPQAKRLWAIARSASWSDEQVKDLLTSFKVNHTHEIFRGDYDRIVEKLKAGPPKPGGGPRQETLA